MDLKHNLCCIILIAPLFIYSCFSTKSPPLEYPTANISTTWINIPSPVRGSSAQVKPLLLRGITGTRFVCGFYCNPDPTSCLLSVLIFENRPDSSTSSVIDSPQPIWSANRDNPVKVNSTLELTRDGDLVLRDTDGTLVWSTGTSWESSVSGMNLTEQGNLVLFNESNSAVWQSFDHPTDCLVPGQGLFPGQKLISSKLSTWSTYSFLLEVNGAQLLGYVNASPPQYFYQLQLDDDDASSSIGPLLAASHNGGYHLHMSLESQNSGNQKEVGPTSQFAKLDFDGHLRVYKWQGSQWGQGSDLLYEYTGSCGYPMSCRKYGICSSKGPCGCPNATDFKTNYFRQSDNGQPDQGCTPITPISCEFKKDHMLLEMSGLQYFFFNKDIEDVGIEDCKRACLSDCSCRAAIFLHGSSSSRGDCFLPDDLFSLMIYDGQRHNVTISDGGRTKNKTTVYRSSIEDSKAISTYLKVQKPRSVPTKGGMKLMVILVSNLAGFLGVVLLISVGVFILRRKEEFEEPEDNLLDDVHGMPSRFSYEDLKDITKSFAKKLGEGGFGSVFEGALIDGAKVAVKQLEVLDQAKKSFLAEVETIGNINHVNLVRLVGFCAEKSHKLLVYEYMCNSSLDKWIFQKIKVVSLPWPLRRKIISGIAKGLAYLHEECRQKILHLDIKPQNILLDENFEAKLSDFGLSKLMDKEQSEAVTVMRGTPGYLAPEWLGHVITEKVDVYSFGVVVLEILSGRKNFDRSQPEEDMHLLTIFKRKAEEERLLDVVDKYCNDVSLYEVEIMKMLRIAAWCLQGDYSKRPQMSVIVKVLEGLVEVETDLNFCFTNHPVERRTVVADENGCATVGEFTLVLPSVLSGPR